MNPTRELERIVKDLVENKHSEVPVWRTQSVCAKILLCCAEVNEVSGQFYGSNIMRAEAKKLLTAANIAQDEACDA